MKSPSILLSFLLLALAAKPLLGRPDPLLDTNGNEVLESNAYYIVPVIRGGSGGGLSLFRGRNQCPLDVIQEQLDVSRGQTVIFSPAFKRDDGTVHTSSDVNIKFTTTASYCFQSTVWNVDDYDKATATWFITTNGVEGNPGAETLQNCFKFELLEGATNQYKLRYCPSVCQSSVNLCTDVGIHAKSGVRRLALTNKSTLAVQFIKAEDLLSERSIAMH